MQRERSIRPEDYREIHRFFDYRTKRKEWQDDKPISLDDELPNDMPEQIKKRFSELQDELKGKYPWLKDYCLYNLSYKSENSPYLLGHVSYRCTHQDKDDKGYDLQFKSEQVKEQPSDEQTSDKEIKENNEFRYPLVRKSTSLDETQKRERMTIVLHGLNEFGFLKYMPWAYGILLGTNAPVAIFPLTFSVNRASQKWLSDRGKYRALRAGIPGNKNVSPFNAIISERLDVHPERFFWGAIQSYWDIVDLVRQIRKDRHPHFAHNARVDFLGFSSGGYLALALLAMDHEGLFSESRACLFATCAEMRSLGGGSPFTLDAKAEYSMRKFYVDDVKTQPNNRMRHWFEDHPEGFWFHTLGGLLPDRTRREVRLRELAPRLLGIANCNDRVMPPGAMLDALQGDGRDTGVRVENLNLGIHEHPFCLSNYLLNRENEKKFLKPFDERYSKELEQFIDLAVEHLAYPCR